jgi:RNA polymerase sigma factor for flagellar operon FliA
MAERDRLAVLFLEHLEVIERAARIAAHRRGLRGADVEDAVGDVRERIMADDYAVIGKFRGESELATYLVVVATRLARDHVVRTRGRWRPSAKARLLGPVAIQLEALHHRDGHSLREAGEILRARGEDVPDRQLGAILRQLPDRSNWRRDARGADDAPGDVDDLATPGAADDPLAEREARQEWQRVEAALAAAMAALSPHERLVLRLRYWDGLSIADVARASGLDQRPLYRSIPRLLQRLRDALDARGVSYERVGWLLEEPRPPDDPPDDPRRTRKPDLTPV